MAAVSITDILAQAGCFNCVSPGMWSVIRLALLARIVAQNTMPADVATLLAEGSCLACQAPGQQQIIELGLLQKIQEQGGGSGGSVCVQCSQTVPVLPPDLVVCDCNIVFGIGAIAGNVYVYDTTTNSWFPVISGP